MSKTRPPLLNPDELKALIDELDLKYNQKKYIAARWLRYVDGWDARARNAKHNYRWLSLAIVTSGALIPALVGLRELNVWENYAWAFSVGSIVASLVVAIGTAAENIYGHGKIWRQKRAATELIGSEGFQFLQKAGVYNKRGKTHAELYPIFADNVEAIIRSEIKDYVVAVKPDKQP